MTFHRTIVRRFWSATGGLAPVLLAAMGCGNADQTAETDAASVGTTAQAMFAAEARHMWLGGIMPVCWEDVSEGVTEQAWVREAIRQTWEVGGNVITTGWGLDAPRVWRA